MSHKDADHIDKKQVFIDSIERKVSSVLPEDDRDGELLGPLRKSAEKELVRKLDMRLLPTIVVIFIMNYIDVSLLYFWSSIIDSDTRDYFISARQ